jgi:hypothetical protein
MRTSEAERQRVAEFLRDACGEGRLEADELDQRLDRLFAGHTVRDMEDLVWDLPGGQGVLPGAAPAVFRASATPGRRRPPVSRPLLAVLLVVVAAAILSSTPPEAIVGVMAIAMVFGLVALMLAAVFAPAGFLILGLAWLANRLWRGRMGPRSW